MQAWYIAPHHRVHHPDHRVHHPAGGVDIESPQIDITDIAIRLKDAIKRQYGAYDAGEKRLVRVEVPVPTIDPLAWLNVQQGPRMYWRGRHADDMTAMTGEAMVVEGHTTPDWPRVEQDLDNILHRPGATLRFHGGMRFNAAQSRTSDWFEFPAYRFVLPRFEWHRRGSKTLLCCNLVLPEDGEDLREVLREVDELVMPDAEEIKSVPLPRSRQDNPGFEGWKTQIKWSLDAFSKDILQKVVLARRVDVQFAARLQAASLLSTLQQSTPNCFHYLVESPSGAVFMGASPERLFFRRGREVFSEAVAGTRPRGSTFQDDEAYKESLLASEKDQREHAYVREYIRSVLESQCDDVTVDEVASEMKLAGGRHLCSRLSGTLHSGVSDLDLLRTLHPTPAVGGAPTADALDIIDRLEDFDRGWYAGPIGWIGRDSAEFAVALRCGVVEGRQLTLFSGAGIVDGSEPGAEWLEIEQKITDFTRILGVSVRDET